jgi:aryl-phospho-beta-D-glucosidase BglC (GH1 family)
MKTASLTSAGDSRNAQMSPPTRRTLNRIAAAIASFLILPLTLVAQLPNPTYGWNLGNTMEPPSGEGTWAPAATQSLINQVRASGFNTIRIPIAWNSHANQTTYQIDAAWMARVKQVVDWCYAANLTVVINSHWDNGWLDSKLDGNVDADVNAKMQSYWTQIATTFINYDSKLLFAGANEPPADTAAKMAELATYYQTFVNAVRATGGQNTNRWLVLSGPSTNIDLTDSLMNTLPSDPTPGRLVVEVHDYSPYQYTLMTQDETWGKMFYFWGQGYHHPTRLDRNSSWGEEDYIISQYEKMRIKFTSKGVPVLLGEFGTGLRTGYADLTGADYNLHVASRTYWNKTLLDLANARGLRPVYWDNGWAGKDGFGLFDRVTSAVLDQASITSLTGGPALPPPTSGSVVQQNTVGGGTKGEVKSGATVSQSFVNPGSGSYQVTKLTLHVSRKSPLPTASLVVYLGSSHGGGAVLGSTVAIAPATVTNTSNGNSWQTLDVVFASPVTLNKGVTYYLNVTSTTAGNKPYFVDVSAANTYAGGNYTPASGGGRDLWFQVWVP